MPAAYPTDAEIAAFLLSDGITVPAGYAVSGYAESASSEFEQETGYVPFLSSGVDSPRTFDPPGAAPLPSGYSATFGGRRILLLRAGLLVLTSVVSNGAALPATQYRLLPLNSLVINRPYQVVEFLVPIWGPASSLVLTGHWGFSATVPDDVFQAILRIAAANILRDMGEANLLTPNKWVDGVSSESFDTDRYSNYGKAWHAYADRVISRYKRIDQWL